MDDSPTGESLSKSRSVDDPPAEEPFSMGARMIDRRAFLKGAAVLTTAAAAPHRSGAAANDSRPGLAGLHGGQFDPAVEDWLDVRSFGAVGDGRQDDTAAILKALTVLGGGKRAAGKTAPARIHPDAISGGHFVPGGVLYFPPGRYLVKQTLVLPPFTCLRGAGMMASTIVLAPGAFRSAEHPQPMIHAGDERPPSLLQFLPREEPPANRRQKNPPPRWPARPLPGHAFSLPEWLGAELVGASSGAQGIRIQDLALIANRESNPGAAGVLWNAGAGCSVERVYIEAPGYGIRATGGLAPGSVENLQASGCSIGVHADECGSLWIAGLTATAGLAGNTGPSSGLSPSGTGARARDGSAPAGGAAASLDPPDDPTRIAPCAAVQAENAGPVTASGIRLAGNTGAVLASGSVVGASGVSATGLSASANTVIHSTLSAVYVTAVESSRYRFMIIDDLPVGARMAANPLGPTWLESYAGANSFLERPQGHAPPVFGQPMALINCGGPALHGWSADHSFKGGEVRLAEASSLIMGVPLAAPLDVYKSARQGPCRYEAPCPAGPALVRLHLSELFEAGAGQRAFHITLNGRRRRHELDIYAEVGGTQALVLDLPIGATGGRVTIDLESGPAGAPLICGIEIYALPPQASIPPHGSGDGVAPLAALLPAGPGVTFPGAGRHSWPQRTSRAPFVDARAAGAAGNGEADDYAVLQRLLTGTKGPSSVYLPPGIYRVSQPLRLSAGSRLRGFQASHSILLFDRHGGPSGAGAEAPLLHASGPAIEITDLHLAFMLANSIALEGASVSGGPTVLTPPSGSAGGAASGIRLDDSSNAVLQRLRITGCRRGVALEGSHNARLKQIDIAASGTGIEVIDSTGVQVLSCTCAGASSTALLAHPGVDRLQAVNLLSWSDGPLAELLGTTNTLLEGCAAVAHSTGAAVAINLGGPGSGLFITHLLSAGFQSVLQRISLGAGSATTGQPGPLDEPTLITGNPVGITSVSLYAGPGVLWRRVNAG